MARNYFSLVALFTVLTNAAAIAAPPPMWDNLVRADSKSFYSVYLLPGADFRGYTKVILEPTDVAFQKDWQRNYNNGTRNPSARISNKEMQDAMEMARTGVGDIFNKAYTDAGYQVVTVSGDDTLRVHTAIINLAVNAPDRRVAGRSSTYASQAGEATVVIEAMDSQTGEILGRVVDRKRAGDSATMLTRNMMTNRNDFRRLFTTWATASANGLNALKSMSPLNLSVR
jgi:hypothetical protein